MTQAEWKAEAAKRFGNDSSKWKFVCPSCGHIASVEDWKKAGAEEGAIAFSCVGRWDGHMHQDAFPKKKGKGPCNYAGGGLFRINPVEVIEPNGYKHHVFAFAEADPVPAALPQEASK
jgi:hypothetical protein